MEIIEALNSILNSFTEWYYFLSAICIVLFFLYLFRKTYKKIQLTKSLKILDRQILDFTKDEIDRRIRYYIWHDCQSIDPQNRNLVGRIAAFRSSIINTLDQLIFSDFSVKHIFLMAAGGMGKTSFLLNYFAYLKKKPLKKYQVELVPMSLKNVYKRLKEIENPSNTILLLDAYDEIIDTQNTNLFRLNNLMRKTQEFYKVIVTCNVQSIPQGGNYWNFSLYNAYGQKNAYALLFMKNEPNPIKLSLFSFLPSISYNFKF